jgi:hypothetical protein
MNQSQNDNISQNENSHKGNSKTIHGYRKNSVKGTSKSQIHALR